MLSGSKAQPKSLYFSDSSVNLTFGCSGTAAKELHALYTKIAGSYFNL